MRAKLIEAMGNRLKTVEHLLDKIDRSVERIEIVTVVREPNTSLSADAYNGLRKQIIAAVGERNAHIHQLAQFDSALRAGSTPDELSALVGQWLSQASVETLEDLDVEGAFDLVGPADAHRAPGHPARLRRHADAPNRAAGRRRAGRRATARAAARRGRGVRRGRAATGGAGSAIR